jgi:hypothetical protein
MTHAKNLRNTLDELNSLIDKLSSGNLQLLELESLVANSRELYELSVVLRYKAYEDTAWSGKKDPSVTEPLVEVVPEIIDFPMSEEIFESPMDSETDEAEQPKIEFSLFDEGLISSAIEPTEEPTAIREEQVPIDTDAFVNRFTSMDISLESQIAMSRLETLVGSFGLNERLQFINELFDGSSEAFSEAIKSIDSQSDEQAALRKASALASQFNWDSSSETVEEFVLKIKRRYA